MNKDQREQIAKMKAEIFAKYSAAKTDAQRAKYEKQWAEILRIENSK